MGMTAPPPRSTTGMSVMSSIVPGDWALAENGADRAGQFPGDVGHEQVDAVADDVAAADHDVGDVRGGSGEHGRLQGRAVGGARGPHAVPGYRDQVGAG